MIWLQGDVFSEWSTRHTSTRDTGISHVEWGSNHDIDLAVKICWQSITISISPDVNDKLMETSIPFIIHNQGNIKIFSSNYPTHPPLLSLSPSFLIPDVGLQWFLPEKTIYFYLTGLLFHINISFKLALGLAGAKIVKLSHELWRLEKIFGFQLPLGLAGQKILILNPDSARTETNDPPSAPLWSDCFKTPIWTHFGWDEEKERSKFGIHRLRPTVSGSVRPPD